MSYQVCFCFWLLTFEDEIAENINKYAIQKYVGSTIHLNFELVHRKYDIIPLLTDVAQAAVKEKVVRVIVATFRVSSLHLGIGLLLSSLVQNLVTKAPSQNLPSMLVVQLLPFVKSLSTRKWTDEDIVEDVQFLRDELKANFDSLTYACSLVVVVYEMPR